LKAARHLNLANLGTLELCIELCGVLGEGVKVTLKRMPLRFPVIVFVLGRDVTKVDVVDKIFGSSI
jgi:hypothetical protein